MPDFFSHYIIADKVYNRLEKEYKNKINDRSLYMLGAQGGDLLFFYKLTLKKTNLGKTIHRISAEDIFTKLVGGSPSYIAGFATHYAVDCTLHPAVFAHTESMKSPIAHIMFEDDLALYISRKFEEPRRLLPRDEVLRCTSPIYDSLKNIETDITMTGMERCLKRYFKFIRYSYKHKKEEYRYKYNFPTLSALVDESIDLSVEAVKCILDGNIDPNIFNKRFLEGSHK